MRNNDNKRIITNNLHTYENIDSCFDPNLYEYAY